MQTKRSGEASQSSRAWCRTCTWLRQQPGAVQDHRGQGELQRGSTGGLLLNSPLGDVPAELHLCGSKESSTACLPLLGVD